MFKTKSLGQDNANIFYFYMAYMSRYCSFCNFVILIYLALLFFKTISTFERKKYLYKQNLNAKRTQLSASTERYKFQIYISPLSLRPI